MYTRTLRTVEHLRKQISGPIIVPGDPDYDSARTIWNAMIDRYPAVIVRCATAADVPPAIVFARARSGACRTGAEDTTLGAARYATPVS